jgi:hypothetical protein
MQDALLASAAGFICRHGRSSLSPALNVPPPAFEKRSTKEMELPGKSNGMLHSAATEQMDFLSSTTLFRIAGIASIESTIMIMFWLIHFDVKRLIE